MDLVQTEQNSKEEIQTTAMGKNGTWTVFLYMCGTNLETQKGEATKNLKELLQVDLSDQVNIIIQTGGTKRWRMDGISSEYLNRYRVSDHSLELLEQLPADSMGKEDTLSDFLAWGIENYPAEKMMVLFWNHGSGSINGLVFDELYNNDSLTLVELENSLEQVSQRMTDKFEIIGFDACLMATLETASMVSDYARYMVASEEIEPAGGWDYTTWVNYISKDTTSDGTLLGRVICDSYYSKCKIKNSEDMTTMSVVDLSKIKDLTGAFDTMAGEMSAVNETITGLSKLTQSIVRAESFGGNSDNEGYSNLIDVGDMTDQAQNVLKDTANMVKKTLEKAVIYKTNGDLREESSGLSVYYPLNSNIKDLIFYDNIAFSKKYTTFLNKVYGDVSDKTVTFTDTGSKNENNDFEIHLDQGSMNYVMSVSYVLADAVDENGNIRLIGSDSLLNSYWKDGTFTSKMDGMWPAIKGNLICLNLIDSTDSYDLYTVPVLLDGVRTNLRCTWIWEDEEREKGHFETLGVWEGLDSYTGMASRQISPLTKGQKITILYETGNINTSEVTLTQGATVTVDDILKIEEIELTQEDYYYMFEIKDIFGKIYYSDFAVMKFSNGKAKILEIF
ncbi:MAG: clostripain-related cysteine peptidase [Velocimicrobium sp.]